MKFLLFLLILLPVWAGSNAIAQADDWHIREVTTAPSGLFAERCRRGNSALPDGCTVRGAGNVSAAWYEEPTARYAHAILGDAIEAGTLAVRLADGSVLRVQLPADQVFEDRFPRVADLDGDGNFEIITIRSSTRRGGSAAVYAAKGGALREVSSTAYIGRSNRWLNISAIADFLGNGSLQIAFVETPHIGGTLKLARYENGALRVVAQARGFSNHQIGSRVLDLSAVADFDGDGRLDLAVPDARRASIRIVTFVGGTVRDLAAIPLPSPVTQPLRVQNELGGPVLYLGLADGRTVAINRR